MEGDRRGGRATEGEERGGRSGDGRGICVTGLRGIVGAALCYGAGRANSPSVFFVQWGKNMSLSSQFFVFASPLFTLLRDNMQ